MTRQEMIDLIGWHYQKMTEEEKNILSRVERIVNVAVLRERNSCAQIAEETVCDTHLPTGVKIYGTRVAKAIRERSNT